jgi:hypothetical protein
MTARVDPLIAGLLDSLATAIGEGDWEDVLRRALVASETRWTSPPCSGCAVADSLATGRDDRRQPPPQEQGWGTRPIRTASSTDVALVEGMGWGTRPM